MLFIPLHLSDLSLKRILLFIQRSFFPGQSVVVFFELCVLFALGLNFVLMLIQLLLQMGLLLLG
jgi:hypothetical protein